MGWVGSGLRAREGLASRATASAGLFADANRRTYLGCNRNQRFEKLLQIRFLIPVFHVARTRKC